MVPQLLSKNKVRYVHRELHGNNVNISSSSPVKELFTLLGGCLGVLFIVYFLLGLAVDFIVPRLPVSIENTLGNYYSKIYGNRKRTDKEKRLQKLLDELVQETPDTTRHYTVYIPSVPQVNAVALPGGNILVFSGLVNTVKSENELAFVLAHELGHFTHRDHLKALGRSLIVMSVAVLLFGQESSIVNFYIKSMAMAHARFSQRQETYADLWAIDLLNKKYGHISGSVDFIKRIEKTEKTDRLSYYFTTHPYPKDRLHTLKNYIEKQGYAAGEKKAYHTSHTKLQSKSNTQLHSKEHRLGENFL